MTFVTQRMLNAVVLAIYIVLVSLMLTKPAGAAPALRWEMREAYSAEQTTKLLNEIQRIGGIDIRLTVGCGDPPFYIWYRR